MRGMVPTAICFFLYWPTLARAVETLPLICKVVLAQELPDGTALTPANIEFLARLAQAKPEHLSGKVAHLEPEKLFELARQALLLAGQVQSTNFRAHLLPSRATLHEQMPWLADGKPLSPSLENAFAKEILEKNVETLSFSLAELIGKQASPAQKKNFYLKMMAELNTYGRSWYHQGKVDRFLDAMLGVQSDAVTRTVKARAAEEVRAENGGEETYSTAGNAMLLTPHHDLRDLLRHLNPKPGETIVDLGSGFGRLGIATGITKPGVHSYGYEIVAPRVKEAQRAVTALGLDKSVHMIEQNLADPAFQPVAAEYYYAFNPVRGPTFDKILNDLKEVGLKSGKRFKLVMTGPAPYEKADAVPWLREIKHEGPPQSEYLRIYEFVPEVLALREHFPSFPAFRRLEAKDEAVIDALMQIDRPSFSLFTSNSLFSWNDISRFEVAEKNGALVLRFGAGPEKGMILEPLGVTAAEKVTILDQIVGASNGQADLRIGYLSPEVGLAMQGTDGIELSPVKDLSDYVYLSNDLAALDRTKSLRDRRGQVRRFEERNPAIKTARVSPVSTRLTQQSHEFMAQWGRDRTQAAKKSLAGLPPEQVAEQMQKLQDELRASETLERRMGPNSLKVALMDGDKMIAFAFGESVKMKVPGEAQPVDVFVLYVQKASSPDKNIYQAINHALVQEVAKDPRFKNTRYFNLMDDWGNPGLRQYKEGYSPIAYGENYVLRRNSLTASAP